MNPQLSTLAAGPAHKAEPGLEQRRGALGPSVGAAPFVTSGGGAGRGSGGWSPGSGVGFWWYFG